MDKEEIRRKSFLTVKAIIGDLTVRKGLEDIWEEIDEKTKEEIMARWQEIITTYMDQ